MQAAVVAVVVIILVPVLGAFGIVAFFDGFFDM